jgi:hypothetical protein
MRVDDWFLTAAERDNPDARIDRGASAGAGGWSVGNQVDVLTEGASYFARLHAVLCWLQRDDGVHFTDWEGDPDERLLGPGTELVNVFCDLVARGVHVRGLLWCSHPTQANFSEPQNVALTKAVNEAGGEPRIPPARPRRSAAPPPIWTAGTPTECAGCARPADPGTGPPRMVGAGGRAPRGRPRRPAASTEARRHPLRRPAGSRKCPYRLAA